MAAQNVVHIDGRELPDEDLYVDELPTRPIVVRAAYLVAGLALFVTALGLMRTGATALVPILEGSVFTDNPLSTLGLGWLGACIVLSGSPVAASALSLLDGGAIDRTESFTMLTGSRLGAAFVVLAVGTLYALRSDGKASGRRAPISLGVLSLAMTFATYVPGAIGGYFLLESGALDGLTFGSSPALASATDTAFGWTVDVVSGLLPGWALFPTGVAMLLGGFALFDRVLPEVGEHQLEGGGESWFDRKWAMFLVGCAACLLTLSVSVALAVLVPLVAKGHLRRANTLPYIAGANITTLVDTFAAAAILGNQDAVRAVAAATISVTAWTLMLLAFAYPATRRVCLAVARHALASRVRLAAFAGAVLVVPVALIAV